MKKIIIALVALLVLLGAGGGGAYFYFVKMKHPEKKVAVVVPPKPIIFAQMNNLVVSVPTTAPTAANSASNSSDSTDAGGSSNQAFIQLSIQFATTDPKAIDGFNALLPIIQAEIVNLLMKQTATQLMDPNTHNKLSLSLLAIANGVLNKNQSFNPPNPFTAAYITNIVQQD